MTVGNRHNAGLLRAAGAAQLRGAQTWRNAARQRVPGHIVGVAVINGHETPIRATTSYYSTPVDQTMIERSNRERVAQLSQALAFWIGRGDFF